MHYSKKLNFNVLSNMIWYIAQVREAVNEKMRTHTKMDAKITLLTVLYKKDLSTFTNLAHGVNRSRLGTTFLDDQEEFVYRRAFYFCWSNKEQ